MTMLCRTTRTSLSTTGTHKLVLFQNNIQSKEIKWSFRVCHQSPSIIMLIVILRSQFERLFQTTLVRVCNMYIIIDGTSVRQYYNTVIAIRDHWSNQPSDLIHIILYCSTLNVPIMIHIALYKLIRARLNLLACYGILFSNASGHEINLSWQRRLDRSVVNGIDNYHSSQLRPFPN
jgi:hypothetical protein